jgi:CubicO group peptidase (beta-lactamase class C family)
MAAGRHAWVTAIVTALGVFVAAGVGLFSYIRATSNPRLHPDPQAAPSVQSADPLPRWADAVKQSQQIARAALAQEDLPGLSVAVGVAGDNGAGEIVWAEGFGWADIEKKVPVAPATRFRIGHTSKALTSAAAGLLAEKNQLNLDEEVQTYVPAFPRKKWPITLRHLMGHTAGIRHYTNETDYMRTTHCERAAEGLPFFADAPLLFEPDTKYQYSTFGWTLVSAAVEAVAGEPFFTFMRTRIFAPLGMTATAADSGLEAQGSGLLTTFYESTWINNRVPATPVDYSCFAGASGFVSTPSDLVRFGLAMIGGKLLQRETVRMLQTPQTLVSGTETSYGLGWMLETVTLAGRPARMAHHSSRTPVGGSTSFVTFPDRGLVVAITTNLAYAATKPLAIQIAEAFATR